MTSIHDRAAGCLLGLACGDALGGAVEFRSRSDLDRSYPRGIRDIMGGGPHRLAIGEYTDDTQMMLAIARACTPTGIDLEAVAGNFVDWYRSGPKDIGIATANALRLISNGTPWQDAGEQLQAASTDGVAGNGTVMRCAPLALRFLSDPISRESASIETSRMTHADSRATLGAVALNQGLAHLVSGGGLGDLIPASTAGIADPRVVFAISSSPSLTRDEVQSGGYVLDTLSSAYWCLFTSSTAEDAICRAVELGSDTDTTGAVAGALAGAYYGESTLPVRWLDVLENCDEIRGLARQLVEWDMAS